MLTRRFQCSDCKCNCTRLPLRKTERTGDTDVDIGFEMAVGTAQRRPSADLFLGSDLAFACGRARVRGRQPCLQHRKRLLSFRRNSDGPRFCTQNESGWFLFRASGRHPNVQIPSWFQRSSARTDPYQTLANLREPSRTFARLSEPQRTSTSICEPSRTFVNLRQN